MHTHPKSNMAVAKQRLQREGMAMQNGTLRAWFIFFSLTAIRTSNNKQNVAPVFVCGGSSLQKRYSKDYERYQCFRAKNTWRGTFG